MSAELPVISFICMGLFFSASTVFWHSRNVAMISLAAWLFCCNLIHGINAVMWAGNTAANSLVWCDIATRVLLAAQIALPGCALSLARNLRRCAKGQEVVQKAYTNMQDLTFSLVIPVVYVVLHVIVQPHRFDITQDFGCSASVYTSSVSLILIWAPPLVICIITFVFSFLAVRARLDSGLVFFSHMQDAPHLTILAFIRPLLTSTLIALGSLTVTIITIYARINAIGGPGTRTVDTWNEVHAHMTEVFIVPSTSRGDLVGIEAEWWAIPTYSFIVLSMTGIGLMRRMKTSRLYGAFSRWFRVTVLQRKPPSYSFAFLPKGFGGHVIYSTPSSPTTTDDGKSFTDDIWYPSMPARIKLARLDIPGTPSSTCSSSRSSEREDPFVQSTLHYIESPTGRKALGLSPLPPALFPPGQPPIDWSVPPPPRSSPPAPRMTPSNPAPRSDSILVAPWPRPPSGVPSSSRTPSPKASAPITIQPPSPMPVRDPSFPRPASVVSIPTSFASSTISMSSYTSMYDDPEHHAVPFQDHVLEVNSPAVGHGPGLAVPKHVRRLRGRDVLPRSLSASSRRRVGYDGLSGGIYMTVMKETV